MRKGKHIITQCMSGESKNLLESNLKDFREQMAGSAATAAERLLAFVEDSKAAERATKVMLAAAGHLGLDMRGGKQPLRDCSSVDGGWL